MAITPRRSRSASGRRSWTRWSRRTASWPKRRAGSGSAALRCGGGFAPTASGPTRAAATGPRRACSGARRQAAGVVVSRRLASRSGHAREAMPATPYVVEDYVRRSDVDFAGLIFYGSYVRFFEIAETELFRACGLAYAQVFDRYDIFLPRKAVHSEFYRPARLDDRLRVATYVGRVGTKPMTLNFDVLRGTGRALIAAGWMVLVCVDRKQLKPRRLPAELVEALAPHTLSLEAARAQLGAPAPAPAPAPPTP